jgi:2-polyprenyl-3-methyl-5-hydroxy-6-metoxy-1,4-benzoquinol methylase
MSEIPRTKEPQYQALFETADQHGVSSLGIMSNQSWNEDPKRTLFTLARYKFVAKMLIGKTNVLEIGCGDAFGTRLVQQTVEHVTAVDFDPVFIDDIAERSNPNWPMESFVHDLLEGPVPGHFDAVFSLDVLEHILPEREGLFIENSLRSLDTNGMAIFGMPSLESQKYASSQSSAGHVNCKSGGEFMQVMSAYFHNVIVFSMNDEVIHTGFFPMAQYLMALGFGKKRS